MENEEFAVDPQRLRAEAEKEPPRQRIEAYLDVIRLLRDEKGFSFREIAAWLQQRGLNIDHNAVWRTYSKVTPANSGPRNPERNERLEQEPTGGGAMTWLE